MSRPKPTPPPISVSEGQLPLNDVRVEVPSPTQASAAAAASPSPAIATPANLGASNTAEKSLETTHGVDKAEVPEIVMLLFTPEMAQELAGALAWVVDITGGLRISIPLIIKIVLDEGDILTKAYLQMPQTEVPVFDILKPVNDFWYFFWLQILRGMLEDIGDGARR